MFYSIPGGGNQLFAVVVGAAAILATSAVYYTFSSRDEEDEFPNLPGIQLYHAWNFFRRRHDFLQSTFRHTSGKSFSFNILRYKVIVLNGEDARRTFFSHPFFNIDQGYQILSGAAPLVSEVEKSSIEKGEEGNVTMFNKKLNKLLNRTRLRDMLPTLLKDIFDTTDKWGKNGEECRIDPFTEIYGLVLVMVARLMTCGELTENNTDLKKMGELTFTAQTSATPTFLLLPWFPSSAGKIRKEATTKLYTMLYTYVEKKRHAEPVNDAVDILIADGDPTPRIIGYLMAIFFVAVGNTGMVSCWMLMDLAVHSEWREKCKKEVQDLISRHVDEGLSSATLYEKLSTIPISAWEDELPVLDACIQESQRICMTPVIFRRYLGDEMKLDGRVVRRGDFLVYPPTDVHLNPEYYPEPHKYDPRRWLQSDPLPDVAFPFLGWGAGRHPCTGMKAAKLEMRLILAVFLMRYEFRIVDKNGKFPNPLPVPDRNDCHRAHPLGASYYLNLTKIVH